MYFWMIVDSWQTLNFMWSYCTWLVLSLHHMWLFKQVEQHLELVLFHWWGCWRCTTVRLPLRFSKHLLPVSGLSSRWSSNSLLQTCSSVATLGRVFSMHRCRIWGWANCCSGSPFELRGFIQKQLCCCCGQKRFLCFRLLQNHNVALSSPFGEQTSTHRGKFVVISFGERCLL